jgi:DUF4097 and DUF4098 domain-containing protein YvlB
MRRIVLFSFVLFLPLLAFSAEKKFEKSYDVSPDGMLIVRADFGDVTIKGISSGKVNIVVTMRGSKADLEDYEVTASQNGNTIELRGDSGSEEWFHFDIDDLEIRYVLEVPEKFNLDISTSGGDVGVKQVSGRIQTETSGGDIVLERLSGEMLVETSGGDIQATDMTGDFRGTTSGGDIVVAKVSGNIGVETSGGDIRLSAVEGRVSAETSGGDISIGLSGSNKGIVAETSGGDIDVITASTIQANLDASTSGGSVVCSLPITLAGEIDESRVKGTLNGGGELIRVRTSGGDIRISPGQ